MANSEISIDALIPQEMARKAEKIGVAKVNLGQFLPGKPVAGDHRQHHRRAIMVGLVYWFIYLRPSWTGHATITAEEG